MPDVVVGAASRPARVASAASAAVRSKRLDLGLLVDAEHDRVLRRGEVQPDDVGDLGDQFGVGGELERLHPPRLHPVLAARSAAPSRRRSFRCVGEQPGRPVRDPELLRRRRQRRGEDLRPIHRPRPTRPRLIAQALPAPRTRSGPARRSPSAATPRPARRSRCWTPHPRPTTRSAPAAPNPARIEVDRVHDSSSSRSPDRRPSGCTRIPHSHAHHCQTTLDAPHGSRRCCEHWSGRLRLVGCQVSVTVSRWTLSVQPTCTPRDGRTCARSVPSWASL